MRILYVKTSPIKDTINIDNCEGDQDHDLIQKIARKTVLGNWLACWKEFRIWHYNCSAENRYTGRNM